MEQGGNRREGTEGREGIWLTVFLLVHSENPTLAMHILTTLGVMVLIFHLSRARFDLGKGESAREQEEHVYSKRVRKKGDETPYKLPATCIYMIVAPLHWEI